MGPVRGMQEREEPTDEALMQRLAAGYEDALGPLYSRYAARIFALASQSLGRATAEEIVQDVFLSVWRKADTFRPERGTFRPWVFQIAHYRILNELRRRSRQPQLDADPEGERLATLPDPAPGPEEAVWGAEERANLRSALEGLPPAQRHALNLAFVEELSHAQVAQRLDLPLGTTKTRIRAGLQKLRASLQPALAGLVVGIIAFGTWSGIRDHAQREARAKDERALVLLTSSETVAIRLKAVPGVPAATHAVYRGQAGVTIAVVTLEDFPPAPAGQVYHVWVRHGQAWTSLGTVRPDARGAARLVVEGPGIAVLPEAVEITQEPAGGSQVPSERLMVSTPPER